MTADCALPPSTAGARLGWNRPAVPATTNVDGLGTHRRLGNSLEASHREPRRRPPCRLCRTTPTSSLGCGHERHQYLVIAGLESSAAESLGLSANASLWLTSPSPQGTNYAVGGATSAAFAMGGSMGINLPQQVGAYSAFVSDHADPNALYVVMIGGNDVRNAALQGTGAGAITDGVDTEVTEISTLADEGAKHFLVVNVPNVGIIPEFAQENPGLAAEATTFSQLYDTDLAAQLQTLELTPGTNLTDFDLFGFNANILADAAAHGFTNTSDPCYAFTGLPTSTASNTGCDTGTSIASCTGTTFIRPPRCRPCGRRGSGRRCPSPRPGRCCSSASQAWPLRSVAEPESRAPHKCVKKRPARGGLERGKQRA